MLLALACQYAFMQIPMTQIALDFTSDGLPAPYATVTIQGTTHRETVTPTTLAVGEAIHVWLSNESPENRIEMIVYEKPQNAGNSKLVNHQVPFGQEMWGDCH